MGSVGDEVRLALGALHAVSDGIRADLTPSWQGSSAQCAQERLAALGVKIDNVVKEVEYLNFLLEDQQRRYDLAMMVCSAFPVPSPYIPLR